MSKQYLDITRVITLKHRVKVSAYGNMSAEEARVFEKDSPIENIIEELMMMSAEDGDFECESTVVIVSE